MVNQKRVFLKLHKVKSIYSRKNNRFEISLDDEESSESEDDVKPKKSKRPLNDNEFEEVPIDQRMFVI